MINTLRLGAAKATRRCIRTCSDSGKAAPGPLRGFRSAAAFPACADDYLRVISERTMTRGIEGPVERLMERVQQRVRRQPGLISCESIRDVEEPTKVS